MVMIPLLSPMSLSDTDPISTWGTGWTTLLVMLRKSPFRVGIFYDDFHIDCTATSIENLDNILGCVVSKGLAKAVGLGKLTNRNIDLYVPPTNFEVAIENKDGEVFKMNFGRLAINNDVKTYKIWLPFSEFLTKFSETEIFEFKITEIPAYRYAPSILQTFSTKRMKVFKNILRDIYSKPENKRSIFDLNGSQLEWRTLDDLSMKQLFVLLVNHYESLDDLESKFILRTILFTEFRSVHLLSPKDFPVTNEDVMETIHIALAQKSFDIVMHIISDVELWGTLTESEKDIISGKMNGYLMYSVIFNKFLFEKFQPDRIDLLAAILAIICCETRLVSLADFEIISNLLEEYARITEFDIVHFDELVYKQIISKLPNLKMASCSSEYGTWFGPLLIMMKHLKQHWPFILQVSSTEIWRYDINPLEEITLPQMLIHLSPLFNMFTEGSEDIISSHLREHLVEYHKKNHALLFEAFEFYLMLSDFFPLHAWKMDEFYQKTAIILLDLLIPRKDDTSTFSDIDFTAEILNELASLNLHRLSYIVFDQTIFSLKVKLLEDESMITEFLTELAILNPFCFIVGLKYLEPKVHIISKLKANEDIYDKDWLKVIIETYLSQVEIMDEDDKRTIIWNIPNFMIDSGEYLSTDDVMCGLQFFLFQHLNIPFDSSSMTPAEEDLSPSEYLDVLNFFVERHEALHGITKKTRILVPAINILISDSSKTLEF